jgi:hypothetical protein
MQASVSKISIMIYDAYLIHIDAFIKYNFNILNAIAIVSMHFIIAMHLFKYPKRAS